MKFRKKTDILQKIKDKKEREAQIKKIQKIIEDNQKKQQD